MLAAFRDGVNSALEAVEWLDAPATCGKEGCNVTNRGVRNYKERGLDPHKHCV